MSLGVTVCLHVCVYLCVHWPTNEPGLSERSFLLLTPRQPGALVLLSRQPDGPSGLLSFPLGQVPTALGRPGLSTHPRPAWLQVALPGLSGDPGALAPHPLPRLLSPFLPGQRGARFGLGRS